ncbi:hypothetical protein Trydic_g23094 [Trypoxylus dichotomus]
MIKVIAIFVLITCRSIGADLNVGLKFVEKIYDECQNSEYLLKCFKIQALKVTNRALIFNKIKLMDGVNLVRRENNNVTNSFWYPIWNHVNFDQFDSKHIDTLLHQSLNAFVSSRRLDIQVPTMVEEGRKKNRKVSFGPLLAAIAIKGGFMALAYKSIIATAGVALLVGKMALLLCAIMSLKKLISERGEKGTTLEIVKHPSHSVSHTHSTSYEDDHYHRSIASGEDLSTPEKMAYTYEPHEPDE